MAQSDVTIRVRTLGHQWETFGVERARGIWPEPSSLTYTHDPWGSATASFLLRRDPAALWPDLLAATPVDIEVGGVLVWSGRIKDTPMRDGTDRSIAVNCEGWQYHLDDDVYERTYVHTKLSEFKDTRGFIRATLTRHTMAGQVTADGGLVQIGWPQNSQLKAGDNRVGVALDLGLEPSSWVNRVVVECESSNNAGTIILYARGTDIGDSDDSFGGGNSDHFNMALTTIGTGPTFLAGTGTSPKRYLHLFLFHNAGAAGAAGADYWVRFRQVQVYSSPTYESGNASILKASDVVIDAKARSTIMLSSDNSQITSTTFNIPEYTTGGLKTPREAITAINAYEDRIPQIDVYKRLVYKARETAPQLEIGNWSGADFEDASANSLGDVVNRTVIEGQYPWGEVLRVERTAGQQSLAQLQVISSPSHPNPSFDTVATSWSGTFHSGGSGPTRDTVVFHSTPASGKFIAPYQIYTNAFTGTFLAGVTYIIEFAFRHEAASWGHFALFGSGAFPAVSSDYTSLSFVPVVSTFETRRMAWTPRSDTATVQFYVQGSGSGANSYIDSLVLYRSVPTIIDKQGFIRAKILPVRTAISTTASSTMADIYLNSHKFVPLTGGGKATRGGVRKVYGGEAVHPSQLGLHTGKLLRLSHRTDPDTGAHSRSALIASVTYSNADEAASFQLDNSRQNFEALLERAAVVQENKTAGI